MGQWLQFRGDRALTGRAQIKGAIAGPEISWKQFIGRRESLLEVKFGEGREGRLPLPAADLNPEKMAPFIAREGLSPAAYTNHPPEEIAPESITPFNIRKVGRFLPEIPELQKLEFESAFEVHSATASASDKFYGRLMAFREGRWQQAWQSEPIPMLYLPNVIVGDFDNAGKPEVAVVPWYDLWVLDLATGKTKAKCRFSPEGTESGRAYGWLGAVDLDGDGRQEFVILPEFENQMIVLGWKDGVLERKWATLIEKGITRKHTILRAGFSPVQDVDGDGKQEIVVSLFDAHGDGKWHIQGYRAMTGEPMLDLPDSLLVGMADVDGDGAAEIFCRHPVGSTDGSTRISIVGRKDGQFVTKWSLSNASFQTIQQADYPLNVNSSFGLDRQSLAVLPAKDGKEPAFFTRELLEPRNAEVRVSCWAVGADGGIRKLGELTGPDLEVVAVQEEERSVLVRARARVDDKAAGVHCRSASAQAIASCLGGSPASVAAIAPLSLGAKPSVVVQGAGSELMAFQPDPAGHESKVLWRTSGRGAFTGHLMGTGVAFGGVLLADLLGDGSLATVAAKTRPNGRAQLFAVDAQGKCLWERDFGWFPDDLPVLGGIILWFAGHFRHSDRSDVLVTMRRNTMHSELSLLLDGRTGEEIWRREESSMIGTYNRRACGGHWMAVFDYDGDGLDDALNTYPDTFYVIEGRSGRPLLERSTYKDIFGDAWPFFGVPVVADFLGKGGQQVLFTGTTYMFGLLQTNGDPIWHGGFLAGTPAVMHGIGDIDGDGKLELLSPGHRPGKDPHEQEFHCYDAASGKLKWKLPLPGSAFGNNAIFYRDSPTSSATADIDGDGRDECLFAIGNQLCAVGTTETGDAGRVEWTLDFPARIGPPAIADAEGKGLAQVVVVCEDGCVYGIG